MQGSKQASKRETPENEAAASGFKELILEGTDAFEQTPEADLYRVQLFSQMLDRYDEYIRNGVNAESACAYVSKEFSNLRERMRAEGFAERGKRERGAALWSWLSEGEAVTYIRESTARVRRRTAGLVTYIAAIVPAGLIECFRVLQDIRGDSMEILEMCCAFVVIALGIFLICTAKKPELHDKIRKKKFALSKQLRMKLTDMKAEMSKKAGSRKKTGFMVMLFSVLAGGVSYAFGDLYLGDVYLAGMLCLIMVCALSCIWLYMMLSADAEKKAVNKLLKGRTEEKIA